VAMGLGAATTFALIGLFIVGVVKAHVAKTSKVRSGLENLVVAGVGGLLAWGIGLVFGAALT